MGRSLPLVVALSLGTLLALPVVSVTYAQETQAKEDRLSGTVEVINKETKTILLHKESGATGTQVVYSDTTKFTKDNKPGSLDDVQNGRRVICLGKRNDKGQLEATRIDVRPSS